MDHDAVRQTMRWPCGVGLYFVPYRTGVISVKIVGYGYVDIVVNVNFVKRNGILPAVYYPMFLSYAHVCYV